MFLGLQYLAMKPHRTMSAYLARMMLYYALYGPLAKMSLTPLL